MPEVQSALYLVNVSSWKVRCTLQPQGLSTPTDPQLSWPENCRSSCLIRLVLFTIVLYSHYRVGWARGLGYSPYNLRFREFRRFKCFVNTSVHELARSRNSSLRRSQRTRNFCKEFWGTQMVSWSMQESKPAETNQIKLSLVNMFAIDRQVRLYSVLRMATLPFRITIHLWKLLKMRWTVLHAPLNQVDFG
jgi:hypothetical protein